MGQFAIVPLRWKNFANLRKISNLKSARSPFPIEVENVCHTLRNFCKSSRPEDGEVLFFVCLEITENMRKVHLQF